MALREEEFERLQNQLLELKSNNYSLDEAVKRKDATINQLTAETQELKKELSRVQALAKLNPLSSLKSLATRKDAKEKERISQLHSQSEQLQKKVDSQEEEFKMTYETLRGELHSLMSENQMLRDFIELKEGGPEFLKSIASPSLPSPTSPPSSPTKASSPREDEFDLGRSQIHPSMSLSETFALMAEKERLSSQMLELQHDLKVLREEKTSLQSRFDEISSDYASVKRKAEESTKLADERKDLIAEMKAHIEESKVAFDKKISELQSSYETEINKLNQELESRKLLEQKLSETEEILRDTVAKVVSLEGQITDLTLQLEESETRRKQIEEDKEKQIILMSEAHTSEVESLKENINERDQEVKSLNQQLLDGIEERKIHEKKGVLMMKELKKQLASEKKRADKLQEKLQEVLNETTTCPLNSTPVKTSGTPVMNDSSSGGSWSFMSKNGNNGGGGNSADGNGTNNKKRLDASSTHSSEGKDNNTNVPSSEEATSPDDRGIVSQSVLEEENAQLVSRITTLQQEKWYLEERVNSLLGQLDTVSKDNHTKTQVIEFYCMNGGHSPSSLNSTSHSSTSHHHHSSHNHHSSPSSTSTDKLTVRKVVDFIKDRGDENLKEINRKLQRLLEETLTKNMFLQKDLELLSNEVVRLSKECVVVPTSSSPPVDEEASSFLPSSSPLPDESSSSSTHVQEDYEPI